MSAPSLAHDSLAEIPEDKLVDRIVTDILWGREFFQLYGMPSGMVNRQCVSLETAPGNPKGDIDVLFCAPNLPERAVTYQVKRIKWNRGKPVGAKHAESRLSGYRPVGSRSVM